MDVNTEIDRMFNSLLPEVDKAITAELEAQELEQEDSKESE